MEFRLFQLINFTVRMRIFIAKVIVRRVSRLCDLGPLVFSMGCVKCELNSKMRVSGFLRKKGYLIMSNKFVSHLP